MLRRREKTQRGRPRRAQGSWEERTALESMTRHCVGSRSSMKGEGQEGVGSGRWWIGTEGTKGGT